MKFKQKIKNNIQNSNNKEEENIKCVWIIFYQFLLGKQARTRVCTYECIKNYFLKFIYKHTWWWFTFVSVKLKKKLYTVTHTYHVMIFVKSHCFLPQWSYYWRISVTCIVYTRVIYFMCIIDSHLNYYKTFLWLIIKYKNKVVN